MTSKEIVLKEYPNAKSIKVDSFYAISINGDDYYRISTMSSSYKKSWDKLASEIIEEDDEDEYKCPSCGSDKLNKNTYKNGLAFTCLYCDRFFRIY